MSQIESGSAVAVDKPDVAVIGGGPAGSTIAALLAERGHDVVLIEKSHHPRFHIGESLLPLNMPLFDRLGVKKQIEAIGMVKYAAEFVSPMHKRTTTFHFADAWDKNFPFSYQVKRAEFDEILFKNAVSKGARAFEGHKVSGVEFRGENRCLISARKDDGETYQWEPRFVVDASGRDTLLSNQFGIKLRNKKHASAALYGHFQGATRQTGKAEGNIAIFWFDHGWFWLIPLADGSNSVGAVCWPYYMKSRKTSVEQFFFDTIALCPGIAERLQPAKLTSPVTATGNYSYTSKHSSGKNYLMLGDAYAFIDPVFSTGVFLAMNSAFVGADAVDECLRQPHKATSALKEFDRVMVRGPKLFSWFIYRVTTPAMRELFMFPSNEFRLQDALLSVLAGDVFRGTPIGRQIIAFKAVYYLKSLSMFKLSFQAWLRRRRSIKVVETVTAE